MLDTQPPCSTAHMPPNTPGGHLHSAEHEYQRHCGNQSSNSFYWMTEANKISGHALKYLQTHSHPPTRTRHNTFQARISNLVLHDSQNVLSSGVSVKKKKESQRLFSASLSDHRAKVSLHHDLEYLYSPHRWYKSENLDSSSWKTLFLNVKAALE